MNPHSRNIWTRTAAAAVLVFVLAAVAPAKDEWIGVRSKNFYLIGNAGEKEIRLAAERLEQFREAFKLLFPRASFDASIDTNVIVFKDKKAYTPFKPKMADGKPDEEIAGYFQPGEDVNYITLSAEGPEESTYGTIFHEYVHFLIDTHFGKSQVPPWFNEGLAEYYQTFEIEDGQKVYLGRLQEGHLYQLQRSKFIPFEQFFTIDNYSLHRNGSHSRSIFYAQAWALVHFLIHSGQGQNLSTFLSAILADEQPEAAFKKVFGSDYAAMEQALGEYVRQRKFSVRWVEFEKKLDFAKEMVVEPLTEADVDAYLGDLLYHTREYSDAEVYLKKALAADKNHTLANTAYGLALMKRRDFAGALMHLERAVASNRKNHFAQYSYAYALSRETMDEFGYVSRIPQETAEKMRAALRASLDAQPTFAPSYQLLAFINLVNNEELDDALAYLDKALKIQPGNPEFTVLAAKIYLRQEKYDQAEKFAEKVVRSAEAEELRRDARQVLDAVGSFRESLAQIKKSAAESTGSLGEPILLKRSEITEDDVRRVNRENLINRLHMELPKVRSSERMVLGRLDKISCAGGRPSYSISTESGPLKLVSDDFAGLYLLTLDEKATAMEVGCDADLSGVKTVFVYRMGGGGANAADGTLLSMTFVPEFFRLKTQEEIARTRPVVIVDDEERRGTPVEFDERRRETMLEALAKALRKPEPGEKRVMGKLNKIECGRRYTTYEIGVGNGTLRLRNDPELPLHIITFSRDADGIEFRCGFGPLEVPAVVTYKEGNDKKLDGSIIAIEFVPEAFRLK